MSELPSGWTDGKLQDYAKVLDNLRVPVNSDERNTRQGNIPYYGATGQVGWIDDYLFDEELLLIGEDGAPFFDKTKPIAYIIRGKSWVNNHAHVLRAISGLTSNLYLKYFLDQFDFHEYVNGTTRLKLTQGSMNEIPVRLAPFEEQRRIVAKLERLLSRVDAAQARLATIPRILKRFRQSVLAAACSGRLTADWRQNHRVEGGQAQEEDWPQGWQVISLSNVAKKIQDGNYGALYPKAHEWISSGVAFITPASITSQGTIDRDRIRFISFERNAELKKAQLAEGDVIFPNRGSRDAQRYGLEPFAISVPQDLLPANLNPQLTLVRPRPEMVISDYLRIALNADFFLSQVREATGGSALAFMNLTETKLLQIPLPPSPEQKEIVRRVEALFKTADALEARYRTAKAHVDKLTQSILAKAFRGDLVPQDPNDEPASRLLERLKLERDRSSARRSTLAIE